jgi:hypothetical protein
MDNAAPSTRAEGQPRLDIHNPNVDQDLAELGRCGTVSLSSGEVCRLPALHRDGCDFQPPEAPRD